MATRNIVPRANGEGGIGTSAKHWGDGQFDALHLAGKDVAGTLSNMDLALAESTGYGIVSGWDYEKCLQFGWATGAMVATVKEDYASPLDEEQVWSIYKGNARVKR